MAGQPTEQTYASDLKEWINHIIKEDGLPFSQAKVEVAKDKKRADILLYDNRSKCILIIEVKRPREIPSDPEIVKQAYGYAESYQEEGLRTFATHNVNILILYDIVMDYFGNLMMRLIWHLMHCICAGPDCSSRQWRRHACCQQVPPASWHGLLLCTGDFAGA